MINEQRALKHFVETADGFHRSSLALAASAAVCFILNSAKPEADASAVEESLKKAITETGLGRSSVYRYISSGRKLAARLLKDFPRGSAGEFTGPLSDVLDARSAQEAANVVGDYLDKKTDIENVDQLDVYLGAPPRSQRGGAKASAGAGAAAKATVRHASDDVMVATIADRAEAGPADLLALMTQAVKQIRDVDLLAGLRAIIDDRLAKLSKPRAGRGAGKATNGHVQHAGRRSAGGLEIHG